MIILALWPALVHRRSSLARLTSLAPHRVVHGLISEYHRAAQRLQKHQLRDSARVLARHRISLISTSKSLVNPPSVGT